MLMSTERWLNFVAGEFQTVQERLQLSLSSEVQTDSRKVFHACDVATGNVQKPVVEGQVGDATSVNEVEEHRWQQLTLSTVISHKQVSKRKEFLIRQISKQS